MLNKQNRTCTMCASNSAFGWWHVVLQCSCTDRFYFGPRPALNCYMTAMFAGDISRICRPLGVGGASCCQLAEELSAEEVNRVDVECTILCRLCSTIFCLKLFALHQTPLVSRLRREWNVHSVSDVLHFLLQHSPSLLKPSRQSFPNSFAETATVIQAIFIRSG